MHKRRVWPGRRAVLFWFLADFGAAEVVTEQDFTALLARVIDVRKMLHRLLKRVKAPRNG